MALPWREGHLGVNLSPMTLVESHWNPNLRISGFGHALFGIAVAGLATLGLVHGNFAPILELFPAMLPWQKVCVYGSGRFC